MLLVPDSVDSIPGSWLVAGQADAFTSQNCLRGAGSTDGWMPIVNLPRLGLGLGPSGRLVVLFLRLSGFRRSRRVKVSLVLLKLVLRGPKLNVLMEKLWTSFV